MSWDSLPQVLNPPGGYVHNENDSPHFTNLRAPVDTSNAYPNFERPELLLRSQHALELIGGTNRLNLEDVVRLKHSYRMLLADRVKNDLVAAVRATTPAGDIAQAAALLERWDNTASPDSRGSTLFEIWRQRYSQRQPDSLRFAQVWTFRDGLIPAVEVVRRWIEQFNATGDLTWEDVAPDIVWVVDPPAFRAGTYHGKLAAYRAYFDREQALGSLRR